MFALNHEPEFTSATLLSKPLIVGFMSVDVSRQYKCDLSQLKFLTCIPKGKIALDLNHNIRGAIKRTTDDNDEKINLLLKFILDQRNRLGPIPDFTFITYRRTLISVMCNAFGKAEPLRIIASLLDGSIYLCSLETPEDSKRRQSRTKQEEKFCAWGYKFEQYILSDLPGLQPNIEAPVIENEEFSLYYCATLGQHELLYGAQIDGMLTTDGTVSKPPKTAEIEKNLDYLRNMQFVELKTNREIQHRRQEQNFKKYKLLRCWCQCYLAGLKGLLVGFRNDEGIVHRLQWFDTEDIVDYCKDEWNPQTALKFLDSFLLHVKNCFKSHIEGVYGKNCNVSKIGPISLQFDMDINKTIEVINYTNDKNPILPDWFINNKKK